MIDLALVRVYLGTTALLLAVGFVCGFITALYFTLGMVRYWRKECQRARDAAGLGKILPRVDGGKYCQDCGKPITFADSYMQRQGRTCEDCTLNRLDATIPGTKAKLRGGKP